jgi:hypothetical protein
MNTQRLIADAGLPEPLTDVVLQTVQRTRLWHSEKLDVADELVGHFRDGLDAGRSADALVESFGDPKQAARLIRRAVKRKRPLAWKIWRRSWQGFGAVAGLMVVVYLYAAIRLFTGEAVIAHDYLAELTSAARAVPEEERAWPLYREAILGLPKVPHSISFRTRPGADGWDEAAAFVADHAGSLSLVRAATRRSGMGYVVGYGIDDADAVLWPEIGTDPTAGRERGLVAMLLPQLAELRSLALLLVADAWRAVTGGDGALARDNIEATLSVARHTRETPILIADLISRSQTHLALETLGAILDGNAEILSDDDLHALAHRVGAVHDGHLTIRLESEKLWFRDLVQRIYTDDGKGDGRPTAGGLRLQNTLSGLDYPPPQIHAGVLTPAASLLMASRREMTRECDRVFARLEAELEALQTPSYQLRYPLVGLVVPALSRVGVMREQSAMERDAVIVAIALELHRRRHGDWPAALEALVPELLPAVPPDRFNGQPLRYRLLDGRPLVYSVGADGDDDGGRTTVNEFGQPAADLAGIPGTNADGDLVLWPL